MGEWAFSTYETVSSRAGSTRNAYELSRVPAGSSGETATAIAANFGLADLDFVSTPMGTVRVIDESQSAQSTQRGTYK